MNVLIIGNPEEEKRFLSRYPHTHAVTAIEEADAIFLFDREDPGFNPEIFYRDTPVFIDVSFASLSSQLYGTTTKNKLIAGFCKLSTFFEREVMELSLYRDDMDPDPVIKKLDTEFERVTDRAGLVTPRVISMIINEAFYTVEDGTANREDIDTAMKLGTNYPFGPFEWSNKIGLLNLYRLLTGALEESGDPRYRPCDLLKREALSRV